MRIIGFVIIVSMFILCTMVRAQPPKRIGARTSRFGQYEGYSEPVYNEWVRTSQYLEMSDGVKLAMDIIRPAENGKPVAKPLPAIWNYYAYVRAEIEDEKVISLVGRSQSLQMLIRHGYIIVVVDARGKGASYGRLTNPVNWEEGKYGYEITEWIASQPWCDGNIGMEGYSYSGNMHFHIAGHAPPRLKAIFPSMAGFDLYQLIYPGGVFRRRMLEVVSASFKAQETEAPVAPVDEDVSGSMLAEAKEEHKGNIDPFDLAKVPNRDSELDELKPWALNNMATHVQAVSNSGIPIYQWAGWFDPYIRDAMQWFVNLENPQKITIGPWAHSDYDPVKQEERYKLYRIERLRWFDYWLKGIDNGIMDEPRIQYAIMNEPGTWTWHTADTWPLPGARPVIHYFADGLSGSISSMNDGVLTVDIPQSDKGEDTYTVDYTTTVGKFTGPRGPNRGREDPDMTSNDAKGLTYTTPLFEEDITVLGHPVVTLYVKSTGQEGNFYVYLEEVDKQGKSHYITDGVLKASHRLESEPPFDNLGLPFHRHFKKDITPIPQGEIMTLRFDLMPTANIFNKGHRIRVTITCANADWDELPEETPAPTITLFRNRQYASNITLPVVK